MGSLVVFIITPLLRSLEISASIISISTGEKFKDGTNWHTGTLANPIVDPNLTTFKTNWSCLIFGYFSKQFVMLPPLHFSTSALRVSIGMWQFTILLILKSISARSFFICGSFSFPHVVDDCNGFFCWIVFSVLPMCLEGCTVTVDLWLAHRFFWFHGTLLSWNMGGGFWFACPPTIMHSFAFFLSSLLIPSKKDGSRCLQQI